MSPETLLTEPPSVVTENTSCALQFNVMPGMPVTETLKIKEYRVWDRYVEASFDRDYESAMSNSPDHLVFLTALVHMQKLTYVALCRELGIEYVPGAPERFKLWPTKLDVKIPRLFSESKNVVQKLWIRRFTKIDDTTYRCVCETRVDDALVIQASGPVYVLEAARRAA